MGSCVEDDGCHGLDGGLSMMASIGHDVRTARLGFTTLFLARLSYLDRANVRVYNSAAIVDACPQLRTNFSDY